MKKKKFVIIFLGVTIGSIYAEKLQVTPMEAFNISGGFGVDIKKESSGEVEYSVPFSVYDFKKPEKQASSIVKGAGKSFGQTREDRQLRSSKPSAIAIQKIIVIGEEEAAYGILNLTNILFANSQINDRCIAVVCKGKSEDMLAFNVKGYPSSADYIEGLITHATSYNFLSKEYTLLNIYVRVDSEGRTLVLPYVEIKDGEIVLTGMAVFKGDKMVQVLSKEESNIMNILKERNGKGILTLQESSDKYINYDTRVKKKVKCNKKEGKYEFNIDLDFQGDIIANTLYKEFSKENENEFEEFMSKKIENMCNAFLDKMKNVYKTDLLELGIFGAAKYGRDTGVDWNKEVSNAEIKVKVKVKIDKIGIGQY